MATQFVRKTNAILTNPWALINLTETAAAKS